MEAHPSAAADSASATAAAIPRRHRRGRGGGAGARASSIGWVAVNSTDATAARSSAISATVG